MHIHVYINLGFGGFGAVGKRGPQECLKAASSWAGGTPPPGGGQEGWLSSSSSSSSSPSCDDGHAGDDEAC